MKFSNKVILSFLLVTLLLSTGLFITTVVAKGTTEVVIFIREGPETDMVKAAAKYWNEHYAAKEGIVVKYAVFGRPGYFEKITTTLLSRSPDYDIMWVLCNEIGRFAAAGVLEPLDKYVSWFVEWVLGALSVYVGWKIFKEWKETRIKKGDVQSEQGASYIAMCMIADDLADRGLTSYASALARTIATRFENIDKPYMESQIAYWQSQLPNLVGWQLLYANYIITAYQTTINMVPIWISYLPPPILEAAGIEIKTRA